jgi:predicted nuclease of predicted toxin-antitoxin system
VSPPRSLRFLLDENADARLALFLRELGHDVATVVSDYPQRTLDRDLLEIARAEARVLITNDLDFGELVIRERLPHAGIILFRLRSTALSVKIERLTAVLRDYADQLDQFLVVTEADIRVRRP